MSYATTADLELRLGPVLFARLTDRAAGVSADPLVAQQVVDEAAALADSLLAPRYATPVSLAGHPDLAMVLRSRVLDLAEYLAWKSSPFTSDAPTRVTDLHRDALRWFQDVAAGRVLLPAPGPPTGRSAFGAAPRFAGAPRTLTHEELDGL